MKWVLLLPALVAACVEARMREGAGPLGYHARVGVPLATAVRAAEDRAIAGRIYNGAPAALGQFPYFGGLVIQLATEGTSACGSTLVSSTRLLTAAHCWQDGSFQARMYTVVLGSVFLFYGGTRIDTSDVEMHPGWRPGSFTFTDDLAIIRIPAVALSNNIWPAALPTGAADFTGQQAQAKGIGITGHGHWISTDQFLAHISVIVISNAQCALSYGAFVTDRILCTGAGAGNANVCSSDSGGPVTIGNVLVGIVSFGNGGGSGCEAGFPAAHSRVSAYRDWITERL